MASASSHTPSLAVWDPCSVLHQNKYCQAASCPTFPCCPEILIIWLKGVFKGWIWELAWWSCTLPNAGGGEDGQKTQEAQVWLLQTQLSQMGWICSQVATVSGVYTICSCGGCWFGFRMAHHPGKQGSAATWGLLLIWFVCVSAVLLPRRFWRFYLVLSGLNCTNPSFQSRVDHVTFSILLQETAFCKNLTVSGRKHTRHISCSIHVTFTVTYKERGECSMG